ncbi:MAG: sigma-54-dependent Fis family transcriptional regulator [Ignavibacteria bacterium]|nr:sigma-54-dependent Fis family transcriptional regulator [Ignavibacteria bacterium]
MQATTILIVDDEPIQRGILAGYLKKHGHAVYEAGSASQAIETLKNRAMDIVLTDYKMPDRTGFDLLKETHALNPEITVVLLTAFGTIEGAVAAMREGAYDYLTKPIDLEELDLLIQRIKERGRLISENRLLKEQLAERFSFAGIISQSAAMEATLNTAGRVALSKAPILIRGESGTGKELVAKAIHFASARKEKPFVAVNCAALNENILESELFGHEKGAFTGADRQRQGRFEAADGGTLFLDEIGDIPLSTQVRLLRVLQEQQFERVGGTETLSVDVRVIAATHKDLESMIRLGSFREDLFYRLNVVAIDLPPLRNRREDIPPLLEHFLQRYAHENKRKKTAFSREAWELLLRYDFPGNVRELQNIVQRAVILSRGETITTNDLPAIVKERKGEKELAALQKPTSLPERVEQLEKELVLEALRRSSGNQSQAAAELGISERNLRYRLKKWKGH